MEKDNILIATYFSFKEGLIQAYTLPYLKLIHKVSPNRKIFLLTFEKERLSLSQQEIRLAEKELANFNIIWVRKKYFEFGFKTLGIQLINIINLRRFVRKNAVKHIHCWGTPGGSLGYPLVLLSSRELILDSFEPHAEAQLENGTWSNSSLGFKVLFFLEKRMARRADVLIYTTRNMIKYSKLKYNAYDSKEYVKPACVDLNIFKHDSIPNENLLNQLGIQDEIVGIYVGKFGGIYHDKEYFQLFREARAYWKGKFKALVITSQSKDEVVRMSKEYGFDIDSLIIRFVPHQEMAGYMSLAHFGITLVKSVPTKKCCTPIKNGEYWAAGLPVIITKDISDDSDIIENEKIGAVLNDFETESFVEAFKKIEALLKEKEISSKINDVARKHRNFGISVDIYEKIYG